jgi:nucleotide-binding universal stress UspA family protein
VAGIDGSPSSVRALRWAIRQAGLTGAAVDAVIAWHYPELAAAGGFAMVTGAVEPADELQESASKIVADVISSTLDPASDVPVRARVDQGHAAQVLLDASAGADLLVVGSRGHGGFAEALLGSVSQHCVQHASCPVVIIRGPVPA